MLLWGVSASPYYLKMQALLDCAGRPYRRFPQEASRLAALKTAMRLQQAKRQQRVQRYPGMPSTLDEYPSVPFYSLDGRTFYYDSSSLAEHLDALAGVSDSSVLIPAEPALAFACHLLDEAFDEFGLYMVHNQRWVGSANTTTMGHRTAHEMRKLLPPGAGSMMARSLYRRQVRRCPYLFSVAPEGYDCGQISERTPPSRAGFPPTHALLDEAWLAYLAAMESLLAEQPFLLGGRFTLADASAYGQLAMNLTDGTAADRLREVAPRTYRWLLSIESGEHRQCTGDLQLQLALTPLLEVIQKTFVPLMAGNAQAYEALLAGGADGSDSCVFNEAGFDNGQSLYEGELLGWPYRAVVKTFQVQVWRDLQARWSALAPVDSALVSEFLTVETTAILG